MIYFTSDLHLGHKSIIRLCERPFNNIREHDSHLIAEHNKVVTNQDTVYDLGDFTFRCSVEYTVECLKALNGKRILLLGNHDKNIRKAYKKGLLTPLLNSGKLTILGEEYIDDSSFIISKVIYIQKQKVILSHYSQRSWINAFRGSIHLFGHSHGNLADHHKSFDVGVDTNNYLPYSEDQIIEKANKITKDFNELGE